NKAVGREGCQMSWDWGSPIALGLFTLMAGGALLLASMAIAVVTGRAKVADIRLLNLFNR
ncbi:MAG TPA: hypothetical protein VFW90_00425, partial [Candidatus Saccharimonadales bacterium]|nr:hypothetical protein [Candidatus Saccharimonadales bacterium]